MIGYPECTINLAHAVTYLASSAKSNASYMALRSAQKAVKEHGDAPVPLHLRNAPTKLMKDLDYGSGYRYAHDFEMNFSKQEYLPDRLKGMKFYEPSDNAREKEIRNFLKLRWEDKYNY